jgi:hypothetical protein
MPTYQSYSGELAKWLDRYVSAGRKEAQQNRPPSNAQSPDHHEATLHAEAEKWIGIEQHLHGMSVTESSKTSNDVRQKLAELEVKVDRMLSDSTLQASIEADMAHERDALVEATVERLTAERDLRFFREENGIREAAVYPESRVMHVAIIVVLALMETVMNAFFYENAQGLLGGFVVALVISVVLMGTSFGFGFGFRYKNLKASVNKAAGWACLILFAILAIYANAVFASFRGEYQLLEDPSDVMALRDAFKLASAEAKNIFILNMQFTDLMSMVLFGLGCLLSCAAFYKGYTFDDKYPSHGAKDRALKAAKKEEAKRRDLVAQRVKEFLQRRRSELDAALHEPTLLIGRTANKLAELEHAKKHLGIQVRSIQGDYERVLRAYRGANVAVRAVEKPAYFDVYPDVTHQITTQPADDSIEELQAVRESVKSHHDRYKDQLNDKLHALAGQSAEILQRTFENFLRGVERVAQEAIDRSAKAVHAAA